MPLTETESLVLKTYNLADADKIVLLLTRDHGVVRGVAKGAKRLKSKFGSGLEPFTIINVTYFQKETNELVSIQNIELVASYFALASDPGFLQKFSYLGDLIAAFSPPHDPNETLYRMVRSCLDAASSNTEYLLSIGVYFKLWVLRLAGYLPDWRRCGRCGREMGGAGSAKITPDLHLLCSGCQSGAKGENIDAGQLAIYAAARRLSPLDFALQYNNMIEDLKVLSSILQHIISRSISREISENSMALAN